jgi:hypothetical protein
MRRYRRVCRAVLIALVGAGALSGCYYDAYTGLWYAYPPYYYPYPMAYPYGPGPGYPYPYPPGPGSNPAQGYGLGAPPPGLGPNPAQGYGPGPSPGNAPIQQAPLPPPS